MPREALPRGMTHQVTGHSGRAWLETKRLQANSHGVVVLGIRLSRLSEPFLFPTLGCLYCHAAIHYSTHLPFLSAILSGRLTLQYLPNNLPPGALGMYNFTFTGLGKFKAPCFSPSECTGISLVLLFTCR